MHTCSEQEVYHEANGTIYGLPQKEGENLTIDGNTVDDGECIFENSFMFVLY